MTFKYKFIKGFTLIELLVVMAIIGMLASVILANINGSRIKSVDASMKQDLSEMRTSAGLMYDLYGTYDTVCDPATSPGDQYRSAYSKGNKLHGSNLCLSSGTTYYEPDILTGNLVSGSKTSTPNQWAATVQLKGGRFFCVDYLGNATTTVLISIDDSPADLNCN